MPKTYEDLLGLKKIELHPPRAPIVSEQSVRPVVQADKIPERNGFQIRDSLTDSTLAIDFSYLTNNSSFQRAILEFIKKFIPGFENIKHRGSKDVMVQSFNENMQNYRECMKELKEVLKKRHE